MSNTKKKSGKPAKNEWVKKSMHTAGTGGIAILSALAGGALGTYLGKGGGWGGLLPVVAGIYLENNTNGGSDMDKKKRMAGRNLAYLGLGMFMSLGLQNQVAGTNGIDEGEMEGFDFKNFHANGSGRVKMFMDNFKEKLPFKKSAGAVSGMGETPAYFVNPVTAQHIDMSALDKIQEKIAAMNGGNRGEYEESGIGGYDDREMEYSGEMEM